MSRFTRAQEIKVIIRGALDNAGLKEVSVVTDSQAVEPSLMHGPVVAIQPPDIDFSTYHIFDLAWEIYIISGPQEDRDEAWRLIDEVIEALSYAYDLPLSRAEPANFATPSAGSYAAYILSWDESTIRTEDTNG